MKKGLYKSSCLKYTLIMSFAALIVVNAKTLPDSSLADGSVNAADESQFFVHQHYHDFLGREPDEDGLAFWLNNIESCVQDRHCRAIKRVDTSAAFFLSVEFQETGFLVYRFYKASYGNMPGKPVPVRREEYVPDTRRLSEGVRVGIGDWAARLESNKQAFAQEFVARRRFADAFPAVMTPMEFVTQLNQNTGGALTQVEVEALAQELAAAGNTQQARAGVLRKVAEGAGVARSELNKAFVLMQYFGYLRRNPDDLPDTGFGGFDFWLAKLNSFGGDYRHAEMVRAFMDSIEYRERFVATGAHPAKTFSVVVTPKIISDFSDPLPSVRTFYDHYQSAMSKFGEQLVVMYVGSGDHVYSFPSDAFSPPPVKTEVLYEDAALPVDPSSSPAGAIQDATDKVSGSQSYRVETNGAGKEVTFSGVYPDNQGKLLRDFPSYSWCWKKRGGSTIAFRIKLRNRQTGEENWLGYYAGATPPEANRGAFAQFHLGGLPTQWRCEQVDLLEDLGNAFMQRTVASLQIHNSHHKLTNEWEVVGLSMAPYDGEAALFDLIEANSRRGISWARGSWHLSADQHRDYLNQHGRIYPQQLSYAQLRNLFGVLKQEGLRRGLNVKVFDGVDAGYEFSMQPWKYGLHPEIILEAAPSALQTISPHMPMHADARSYAGFPDGVAGGTLSGDFIAKQIGAYVREMRLDGIYSTNGFGTVPQSGPADASFDPAVAEKLTKFFCGVKAELGGKQHVWMDTYFSTQINRDRWSMTPDSYRCLDYVQLSTFFQNKDGEATVPGWLDTARLNRVTGDFKTPEQYMKETIESQLALKSSHPHLKVLWTFYFNDPWYRYSQGAATSTATALRYKDGLDGMLLYSNDYRGGHIAPGWLSPLGSLLPGNHNF